MKIKLLVVILIAVLSACESKQSSTNVANVNPSPAPSIAAASPTPVPTIATPKDGDYPAKGVVTKINLELGSIELDHEEIKGVMPAMLMEFFVTDKKMLAGLKVGDKVDFVLRYKDPTETIVDINKIQ